MGSSDDESKAGQPADPPIRTDLADHVSRGINNSGVLPRRRSGQLAIQPAPAAQAPAVQTQTTGSSQPRRRAYRQRHQRKPSPLCQPHTGTAPRYRPFRSGCRGADWRPAQQRHATWVSRGALDNHGWRCSCSHRRRQQLPAAPHDLSPWACSPESRLVVRPVMIGLAFAS